MKTAIRTHIAKFSIALWVLIVASVQASIMYDYTGNPFTTATGVYTTSDKITYQLRSRCLSETPSPDR